MGQPLKQPLLTLKNLGCTRAGRRLFEGLNLRLYAGQCLEIHGPNGSGKSTLLRLAAGLFPDYEGSVTAVASFYLGHRPAVSALLSPRENLEWYRRAARGRGESACSRPGVQAALAAVGLAAWSEIPCGQLSLGQQRRTGLARALLSAERLWLLDEPLTALDAQGRDLVGRLVAQHCAAGGAALCATHQALGVAGAANIELGQGA